jgi:hypothetical protein
LSILILAVTKQQRIEWNYLKAERLGILCGAGVPTDEQIRIATKEADQWVAEDTKREKFRESEEWLRKKAKST